MVPYLTGLVLISYLGAFGGKNIIPFGWDFLVIGIFSLAILYLAVKNRAPFTDQTIEPTAETLIKAGNGLANGNVHETEPDIL